MFLEMQRHNVVKFYFKKLHNTEVFNLQFTELAELFTSSTKLKKSEDV